MRRRQFLYIAKGGKNKFSDRLKAGFAGFCYRLANSFLKIVAYFLWPGKISVSPKKICVYRVGNIGDIICAIPVIIAIRRAYPQAEITLLTSTGRKGIGAKELIDNAWFLDKIRVYYGDEISGFKKTNELIKKIRSENFDLWIELSPDHIKFGTLLRNLIFAKLCGARKAVGFELSVIKLWPHSQFEVFFFQNEVERMIDSLKNWGLPLSGKIEYDLPIPEESRKSASEIIRQYGIAGEDIFGLVPGAGYEANQWPLDNFVEVGKFIFKNYPQAQIIVFGGPADAEKGEYIRNKIGGGAVINLCGKLSLLENAFIINKLRLMVANNTGLMHMAALAGKKVITIFSATEFDGKWFPYGENVRVLIKDIPCAGCYYKKCPYNYRCIKNIRPEDVEKEI